MKALAGAVLLAAAISCGDNGPPPVDAPVSVDAPPSDPGLLARLNALPGVTASEQSTGTAGYSYYVLHFTQPVDHADPSGPTFQQEVSLLSRDRSSPMIVETDGYWDYTLDQPVELTELYTANQISIEHRFFASSIPESPDWSKLTIDQMAADEHAIVTALKTIYTGPYIASGASKGGMTSVYYRRFYPDDVVGTVPYVAPESVAEGDTRYADFLGSNGTQPCHQNVRDLAVEMLKNRRAMLEARATDEAMIQSYHYTKFPLAAAVEDAVLSLEWSFWQYYGVAYCDMVPATSATDDAVWQFLDLISPPSSSDDDYITAFAPYYYQSYYQLGYPDGGEEGYLGAYEMYGSADYGDILPDGAPAPAYDGGSAMHDVDDFVEHDATQMVFVYGQWDPWTGGAFAIGSDAATRDVSVHVQPEGTHGSSITGLGSDQTLVENIIGYWVAVPLVSPRPPARNAHPREPHVPPAILRALRTHKR